ncbi:MAG: preprotein translocase subunit SecA [Candidatus Omnitrophica bacterium]|nr:preprotein translocase subunit SecA [Candidatus Omnitrophota bacterium]
MFSIFGTESHRILKQLDPLLNKVNSLEAEISGLSDDELRAKTDVFRQHVIDKLAERVEEIDLVKERFKEVVSPDEREKIKEKLKAIRTKAFEEILPEAFAVVREVAKRTINMRHFDVQILGGIVLHEGMITEMTTGEGKTLVATLPLYLNALAGKGAHLVTVNDYLAQRDRQWMGPVYESLGLTVGVIQHNMDDGARKEAYNCDITYGTNNEFGFDYLRDNMKHKKDDMVQRGFYYAIVDEVDSILIDEARTPLIISGPVEETYHRYDEVKPFIDRLYGMQKASVKNYLDKLSGFLLDNETDSEAFNEVLYIVHKGLPKDKRLLKMIAEHPRLKRKLDEAISSFERKGFESERLRLESELYYVYNEKTRDVTLAARGQGEFLKVFPGELEVEDIDTILIHIRNDSSLSDEEKASKEREAMSKYEIRIRRLENLRQLLKAYVLFDLDVEYVVVDNKVVIVDEFTGRMMPGRRFSDGIHEAIEAKEGLEIQKESQTLATITFQNFFRMYSKLAGMTGTAMTEAAEFKKIYKLTSVSIPTNKPLRRSENPDLMYKTEKEKFKAACEEITECHKEGRPVLIGTISVEKSERLSDMLTGMGIPHHVLNAKHHAKEAEIITRAGQPYAVTISTNMAGRGTDIVLGEGVAGKGGLHVIGTERHEARRIDNQLRGRAGRQGDPGSSRFYLSLEDDLMRIFGSDRISRIMEFFSWEEGMPIEHKMITKSIEIAQKRVEEQNFSFRKYTLEYDNVMNIQRNEVYGYRQSILESEDTKDMVMEMLEEQLSRTVDEYLPPETERAMWRTTQFFRYLSLNYLIGKEGIGLDKDSRERILEEIIKKAKAAYEYKEKFITPEMLRQIEKFEMLRIVDSEWMHHLHAMDYLREGIQLRAYGQRDPLLEYKQEAHKMFFEMEEKVRKKTVENLFRIHVAKKEEKSVLHPAEHKLIHDEHSALAEGKKMAREASPAPAAGIFPGRGRFEPEERPEAKGARRAPFKREDPKVGRNDPCPCGSGKKYKKCCGK